MTDGQKPLVKIQRAELVKFKRAPTQWNRIDMKRSIQQLGEVIWKGISATWYIHVAIAIIIVVMYLAER